MKAFRYSINCRFNSFEIKLLPKWLFDCKLIFLIDKIFTWHFLYQCYEFFELKRKSCITKS